MLYYSYKEKVKVGSLFTIQLGGILRMKNFISVQKHDVTYDRTTKTFTVEVSQIDGEDSHPTKLGNMFYLSNEKTGLKHIMHFHHMDMDDEGDVLGWWYKGSRDSENFKLLIIND